jgi:sporulation protein YlmC with PRC-barrel domain
MSLNKRKEIFGGPCQPHDEKYQKIWICGVALISQNYFKRGGPIMFTRQPRGSRRICSGFLIGVVCLAFLLLNGFAAEVQGGNKAEQQTGSLQQERMYLQEGFRASKIIDQTVKNALGEKLGEVDDLIMSRNGKVKKVILSVGGFLGIGDRLVAVPFKSLQISEKGDIVYSVTKQQLENHPVFSYRREGLYGYYYEPFYPMPAYGMRREYRYPPPPPYGEPYAPFPPRGKYRGEYGPWEWEYFPERLRISAILNRAVLDDKGEEVGEVDDLIINRNGKVDQIILSVGGFLGIDEKLVAMPFKPLKVTDLGIVYNVSKQELKNRPGFGYEKK